MIASRVCARVRGPIRRVASPSGPRWLSAPRIRLGASASNVAAGSRIAAMPHTAAMLAEGSAVACRARVARSSRTGLEASRGRAEHAARSSHEGKVRIRMYRAMGYVHSRIADAVARLRDERGQGTVEYVALILLVALVMAGVVAAMKGFKTDEGKQL